LHDVSIGLLMLSRLANSRKVNPSQHTYCSVAAFHATLPLARNTSSDLHHCFQFTDSLSVPWEVSTNPAALESLKVDFPIAQSYAFSGARARCPVNRRIKEGPTIAVETGGSRVARE